MKKNKYADNPLQKRKFERNKYEVNPQPKRKYEKNKYETNKARPLLYLHSVSSVPL